MTKIFKISILLISAVLLTGFFTGCADKDIGTTPENNDHERIISLRIVETHGATRTAGGERPVCDGEAVRFNSGNFYLVNADGFIRAHFTIGTGATDLSAGYINVDDLRAPLGVHLPAMPRDVRRVVLVGNTPGLPVVPAAIGAHISTVEWRAICVLTQHDAFTPGVNMFGAANLTHTAGDVLADGTRVYRGSVQFAPTVARFEVNTITGQSGSIVSFDVAGIFMDNLYREARIDGSILPVATDGNVNFVTLNDDEAYFTENAPGTLFTSASNNALFDFATAGTTGEGALHPGTPASWRVIAGGTTNIVCQGNPSTCDINHPNVPNVWAYHLFATPHYTIATGRNTEPPRIIIRLRNVVVYRAGAPNLLLDGDRFLSICGFTYEGNTHAVDEDELGRFLLQYILAGNVYALSDILFNESHLSTTPSCDRGLTVPVSVSMDWWNERPARPDMPIRQRNPEHLILCPGEIAPAHFDIGVATGSGTFQYRWVSADSPGGPWTPINAWSNDHTFPTGVLFSGTDIWVRREAQQRTGTNPIGGGAVWSASHFTAPANITLPERSYYFPAYVEIRGIKWATRNVDLSTSTGFTYHPADAGMFFQWGRHYGWRATPHPSDNPNGTPTQRWNPTLNGGNGDWEDAGWPNTGFDAERWPDATDPCPAGWRLPTEDEFRRTFISAAGGIGSNRWIGESWNPSTSTFSPGTPGINYGLGCALGRLFYNNQLFLPAAGWRSASNGSILRIISSIGWFGDYWSSDRTDNPGRSGNAWHYRIASTSNILNDVVSRRYGLQVRCVKAPITQPNPVNAWVPDGGRHTFDLGVATGGTGTFTYQWQISPNGTSGWTNISGATDATFQTPVLTVTNGIPPHRFFRRVATSGGVSHETEAAEITVWALYNLASRDTFVEEIYHRGAFFQWNTPTAWSSYDPRRRNDASTSWVWSPAGSTAGWENTQNTGAAWNSTWDPCPEGWVTPNQNQLNGLGQGVWIAATAVNPVTGTQWHPGRIFGPGANTTTFDSSTQVFLPAAGWRSSPLGALANTSTIAGFWSVTPDDDNLRASFLTFGSGSTSEGAGLRVSGFSIRCVAEN